MNMESSILPAKLRELRRSYGYTQDYVASFLGVVRQTYSHYETGKRTPNPESLYKLAGLYRISVDDLMQFTLSLDKNIYYDAPSPTKSGQRLADYVAYMNNPDNMKKCKLLSEYEKRLLYYFGKLSESDKKEIIEFTKIKAGKELL